MFPHRVQTTDAILGQAMLLPMPYGMSCPITASSKDRQADNQLIAGSCAGTYDVPPSMFPISNSNLNNQPPPFVILPRADLEFLRQEVASLKNSMEEFQTVVSGEIQKLRVGSETLQRLVENQRCVCKEQVCRSGQNSGAKASQLQQCMTTWESSPTYARSVDTSSMSNPGGLGTSSTSCLGPTSCTPGPGMSCTPGLGQSCSLGLMGSCDSVSGGATFDYMSPQHGTDGLQSFGNCSNNSDQQSVNDNKPLTQLLAGFDVYVNKMTLQIIINEAQTQKDGGALFVLRRIIPLVFPWEELASSRGQGLNCKLADSGSNKYPLDPMRVMACKSFMRKYCLDYSYEEPSDKAVNQTFNHQVKYSRRRIKTVRPREIDPSCNALNYSSSLTEPTLCGQKTKKTGGKKSRRVGRNLRY